LWPETSKAGRPHASVVHYRYRLRLICIGLGQYNFQPFSSRKSIQLSKLSKHRGISEQHALFELPCVRFDAGTLNLTRRLPVNASNSRRLGDI
jgi:hypothetical protein